MGLGRLLDCDLRNMTGLACNRIGVCIDTLIAVKFRVMAVPAGNLVLVIQAHRSGTPTDHVIFGLVAVNTLEVISTHVDVDSLGRISADREGGDALGHGALCMLLF